VGDFAKAQRIADLAAAAIRHYRAAYRAVGQPIPEAFRIR
jgi:hypothetical protein